MRHHLKKSVTLMFENDKEATLSYYILENDDGSFGVRVSKFIDHSEIIESSELNSFTYCKAEIDDVLDILAGGCVTPISLKDILLDLFEEKRIDIERNVHAG